MRTKILWALVALNVVLAGTLIARVVRPNAAVAQSVPRARATYQMITGDVNGSSNEVVYVVDTTNGILGAMTYDDTRQRLQTMAPINLVAVFDAAMKNMPRSGNARR